MQSITNNLFKGFSPMSRIIIPLSLLLFIIILSITPLISYAEMEDDQDKKVRTAVVKQLLLLKAQTHSKEQRVGEINQAEQEPKESVAEQPNNSPETKDSEAPKVIESSETPKVMESSETPKVVESSETPKVIESSEAPKVIESSEAPKIIESSETPKVIESTEAPKVAESSETPKMSKGIEKKEINITKKEKTVNKVKTEKKKQTKKEDDQTTPLIELLSKEELNELMKDALQPITPASSQANIEKRQDTTSEITTNTTTNPNEKSASTREKTEKSTNSEDKSIPVGRIQLGRNIPSTPIDSLTETGWIYLGHFEAKKWQTQTLDVGDKLPKIGNSYAVKATMINVRDALPQKGKMGKTIKAVKHKDKVKILTVRGLGRNRAHYWAKIAWQ